MEALFYLLPLSLILSAVSLGLFVWAVRDGQFDDLEGPRWRILQDEDPLP
ncbi:MAG TPA: cbb3-type cytochrome oxidase assembly protein CcoS [Candidatus Nitrosotenuis sp.]|jgi:cbb3-type cytochrome oxidase maturation protein|nr:cbb3-type cytochrome oxidase assembly protein CcoS [Candidatus Nitrosotenuis sp.]